MFEPAALNFLEHLGVRLLCSKKEREKEGKKGRKERKIEREKEYKKWHFQYHKKNVKNGTSATANFVFAVFRVTFGHLPYSGLFSWGANFHYFHD